MNNTSINDSSSTTSGSDSISTKTEDLNKITNQVKVETYKITVASDQKPAQKEYKIELTDSDKALLERLDMEHRAKLLKEAEVKKKIEADQLKERSQTDGIVPKEKKEPEKIQKLESNVSEQAAPKVVSIPNPKSKLKVN